MEFSNTYDDIATAEYAAEYYEGKGFGVEIHGLKVICFAGAS